MSYIGADLSSDIQVNKYNYIATSGQTDFACTYDRAVDVYVNGLKLANSDFTATDGVKIVLDSGLNAGDIVDINAYFDVTYGGYDDAQIDALLDTKVSKVTSTDNAIVRFDGTTGQVQDSNITIDDNGNIGSGTQSFNGFGGTGFKNYIINGGFDVWQRGTSFVASAIGTSKRYIADRWSTYYYAVDSYYHSRVAGEKQLYAIRFGRGNGETTTFPAWLIQSIETINSKPLAGKTVTVSFRLKKGNGLSQNINLRFVTGTGIDEDWAGNFTGQVIQEYTLDKDTDISTNYQDYSAQFTVASNVTQIAVGFIINGFVGTASNDYIEVEQFQLEEGSVATPFEQRPYGLELSLCQRYYEIGNRFTCYGSATYISDSAEFKVAKRVSPSVTIKDDAGNINRVTAVPVSGAASVNNISIVAGDTNIYRVRSTISGASGTYGGMSYTYLASAEL